MLYQIKIQFHKYYNFILSDLKAVDIWNIVIVFLIICGNKICALASYHHQLAVVLLMTQASVSLPKIPTYSVTYSHWTQNVP